MKAVDISFQAMCNGSDFYVSRIFIFSWSYMVHVQFHTALIWLERQSIPRKFFRCAIVVFKNSGKELRKKKKLVSSCG